jgi:hypothetical protein
MSCSETPIVRSALLVLTLIASCVAQETPASPKTSTSAHTRPDDGSISGVESGIYRNSYFGLTYHLPEGWYVDTHIFKAHLAGTSDVPAKGTFLLLSANQFPLGTPGLKFNPDLAFMAISVSAFHKVINTGNDYLIGVMPGMVNTAHDQLLEQGAVINVGGRKFYRADYKRALGYQAIVCTVWKGYVLVWTFVGQTTAQLDELVTSMQSISFEKP